MGNLVELENSGASLNTALVDAEPVLRGVAERLCATAADAEDLVQDTLERAMRQGLPGDVQNPLAWLVTMMRNLFIDRFRAAARIPPHTSLDELRDNVHDNVTSLDIDNQEPAWSRATIEDVRAALETVSSMYREVYILHTFERLSYEAIAERLKVSRVTVGTRLTRARLRLRKVLVGQLGPEGKL